MSKLDALRAGGAAHPDHEFSEEERERIESLTEEEVAALISAKAKLGHDLATKQHSDGDDGTHPNTFPI